MGINYITCHENNLNKYKFVTMAKTIMNKIKQVDMGFKRRTNMRLTRGVHFCKAKPIAKGTINPTEYVAILV